MSAASPDPANTAADDGAGAERQPDQRARLSGFAAVCRVDGCGAALASEKRFYRRSRCCKAHALAEQVFLSGEAKRFCQQCCGFHDVAAFDGPRRSCRERLAAHKDRQRRKWQASHGRRGSDSASSGHEDEGGDGGDGAGQPTTVTRAGRPSRRPSLLRENPKSGGTPDSDTSPERRLADLKRVSPSAATAADGPFGSSPDASGHGGSYFYGGGSSGYGSGTGFDQQQQQQPQQRLLQPSAFQQALAASRRHSGVLSDELRAGAQLRARRSASMSQMQAQALPSAEFWMGERGELLAPPQHPRNVAAADGIPSREVSWFPDLQAWHRSPTQGGSGGAQQEHDTEAALWSRRPTKRRSVPVPEAAALAAEAAAAADGLWPPQQHTLQPDLGFGTPLGPPDARGPHPWGDSQQLQRPQQHPPPLALPQQQWMPAMAVHRDEGLQQLWAPGGSSFDTQLAAAATDPASAQSHATTTAAMDYDWEASVAAADVQQGLAAMAMHGGSSSNLQQDRQALAAEEELHREADAAAGMLPSSLGLPNEEQARAFASQAPEPLWLAQQLVGATMENKHRPLYSYGLAESLHPSSHADSQQQASPQLQQRPQAELPQRQQPWQAPPPLQQTGRYASTSAPDFGHVGHTLESMHEAARGAQQWQQQQQQRQQEAAEQLRQHQQAAWQAQQAGMEARQAEVLAVQQELHAEYRASMRNMQRQLASADEQWDGRGSTLPSVDISTSVKSAGVGGRTGAGAGSPRPRATPGMPLPAPLATASADALLQGGWAAAAQFGQPSPVGRPGSAQPRPPASPPQHRPNSAM